MKKKLSSLKRGGMVGHCPRVGENMEFQLNSSIIVSGHGRNDTLTTKMHPRGKMGRVGVKFKAAAPRMST